MLHLAVSSRLSETPGASCAKGVHPFPRQHLKSEMTVEMCGAPRRLHGWRAHVPTAMLRNNVKTVKAWLYFCLAPFTDGPRSIDRGKYIRK